MIRLEDYIKIKDNYCICYFGMCQEYLVMLELLKPRIEARFPGLNFYLGCRDDQLHVFSHPNNAICLSELKKIKQKFAHIREIRYKDKHPIQEFLKETQMDVSLFSNKPISETTKATIVVDGNHPTKSMTQKQIEIATRIAREKGFHPEVGNDWKNSGLVIGVESPTMVRAGYHGVPLILFDNGIGSEFYKKLFPFMEIILS